MASQHFNADSPQSQVNLGLQFVLQGLPEQAVKHYEEAIALDDSWVPAYVNLADLYRMMRQDGQGQKVLNEALERFPQSADLHFSFGTFVNTATATR